VLELGDGHATARPGQQVHQVVLGRGVRAQRRSHHVRLSWVSDRSARQTAHRQHGASTCANTASHQCPGRPQWAPRTPCILLMIQPGPKKERNRTSGAAIKNGLSGALAHDVHNVQRAIGSVGNHNGATGGLSLHLPQLGYYCHISNKRPPQVGTARVLPGPSHPHQ
jgi:hypothetical protein